MTGTVRRLAACAAAATAAALVFSGGAQAHHSTARFDTAQSVTVEGVVTRYDWANPHVYIYLDQTTEGGETVEWEVESMPPAVMRRMGWSPDTLNAGDPIVVTGNPTRNADARGIFPTSIKRADVTVYDMMTDMVGLLNTGAPPDTGAAGLDGLWTTPLDIVLAQKFAMPSSLNVTEAGAAAIASYDEATMHPGANCVPNPPPLMMIAPDVKRITTGDGVVTLASDFDDVERTIHLDVADHEGAAPSVLGHSIGRWEDGALVIDTAAFAEHRNGNGLGLPSGTQKHLVERLALNEDGTSLDYHFELSDPEYLAEPLVGDTHFAYSPEATFEPVACNVEVARRFIDR